MPDLSPGPGKRVASRSGPHRDRAASACIRARAGAGGSGFRGAAAEPDGARGDSRWRDDHGTTAASRHVHAPAPRFAGGVACVRQGRRSRHDRHQEQSEDVVSRPAHAAGASRSGRLPRHAQRPKGEQAMMHRVLAMVILLGAAVHAQVSYDRLLRADAEPHNWLTYSGAYTGHRYSTLTQITPENVGDLQLRWVFQARSLEKFEATPLVVDGVMYTVQPPN